MIKSLRNLLSVLALVVFCFCNISNSYANTFRNVANEVYQHGSRVASGVYQNTQTNTVIGQTYQGVVVQPKPTPPKQPIVPIKVTDLVKPSIVWATTVSQGKIYGGVFSKKVVGSLPKGAVVQVIRDREQTDYNIAYKGISGWVKAQLLKIPPDPATNAKLLSKKQLEDFVNLRAFVSNTNQLIWVDIDRQVTNVFTGKKGQWKLARTIPVATGRNSSPTVRGTYKVQRKGKGFLVNEDIKVIKDTQFNGSYKFHSVLLDKKGKVVDGTVLKRRSHGCIRMAVADATWIQDKVLLGSAVWIY